MWQFASQAQPRRHRLRGAAAARPRRVPAEPALTMRTDRPIRNQELGGGLIMVPLLIVVAMFVLVLVS